MKMVTLTWPFPSAAGRTLHSGRWRSSWATVAAPFTMAGRSTREVGRTALIAGDFSGNGHLDLATANYISGDVSVLLGNGAGGFEAPVPYPLGQPVLALVAGNFQGDTGLDLAALTKDSYSNSVSVLLNDGAGKFLVAGSTNLGTTITSLVAGDFTGDDNLDLAVASSLYSTYPYAPANNVSILVGNGHGRFTNVGAAATGSPLVGLVAGDFNGDGRLDFAGADQANANVKVLLGSGTGSFLAPVLAPNPVESTPLLADLDTASGALVLTESGRILFRQSLPDQPGAFAPPVVVNADPLLAARDVALVQNAGIGNLLAALDANTFAPSGDPTAPHMPRVSVYQRHADGTFTNKRSVDLPAGFLPAKIASVDLTGDGLGDLVISAATSDQVFVAFQISPGVFAAPVGYSVGVNPSAIELVDLNGDKHPDLVVTDRFSGQVSIRLNDGSGAFGPEERFRAGMGLYGMVPVNGTQAVQALEGTDSVVAGTFIDGTGTDLIVINSGTDSISLLVGDGHGGFLNPEAALTTITGAQPTAIVAGHFFAGDSNLDLAILSKEQGTIALYRGDGRGDFTLLSTVTPAISRPA